MNYKLVKVIINTLRLVKVIFNIIVQYFDMLNLIIANRSLLFTLKFLVITLLLF